MADLSDIFVRVGADIEPLKKGFKSASDKLTEFNKKTRESVNAIGKVGAAAVAAGAALGVKLVSDSLNAVDAQAKLAKQLGTTTASISTLDRAANMSGISLKNIEAGAKNLEVVMGEAAQGTGAAVDTLERLGLTAQMLEGLTLDQKILKINEAIKTNIPVTEQAAAASDLFGKKAGFAISQLDSATIAEASRQVTGFGVALSDIDAKKIEDANDAMATIGLAVTGVANQFTVELAPILTELANGFKEAAIETGGFRDEGKDAISGIATAVGFLGNAWRGFEIIIKGLEVTFEGLSVASNVFITRLVETLDKARQGWVMIINEMIEGVNKIPGINLDKMVTGKSALAESMRASVEGAKQQLAVSVGELNALMLEPLPSDLIEARLESIRANAAAEVLIETEKQTEISLQEQAANEARLREAESFGARWRKFNESFRKEDRQGTQQFFSDLATLTGSGNKKLFEIGKIAARSNVIIDTNEAAMKAYNWAAKWGGPVAGGIAAGAAVLAGGARLSAINSTSFGGGGSAPASSAGGGDTSQASAAAQPQQQDQSRTVRFETVDPSALVSGSMINKIADELKQLQDDGYKLI